MSDPELEPHSKPWHAVPCGLGWFGLACLLTLATPAPLPAAIGFWEEITETFAEQPGKIRETYRDIYDESGKLNWRSRIPIDDPYGYPRVEKLDCDDESSIFYTYRPNLIGQDVEAEWDYFNLIATDRPDFTDATYSVGRGVTVLETGYSYRTATDLQTGQREINRQLPELLLRYGITDELEIRARWDGYVMSDMTDGPNDFTGHVFGDTDLYFSVKYEILQQDDWRPMITAVTGLSVPTGSPELTANAVQPYLNLVGGWGLRRWVYLKVSANAEYRRTGALVLQGVAGQPIAPIIMGSRDSQAIFSSSVSLQFQVSKRWGGYTEWFGFTQLASADNRGSNYFNYGACYYVTPNIQLDLYRGVRLSQRIDESFIGAGFSTRW